MTTKRFDELCATTVCADNLYGATLTATTVSADNFYGTTISATDVSAATFSGTNVYATTVTGTNLSATTFSGTNVYASIISAASASIGTDTQFRIVNSDNQDSLLHVRSSGDLNSMVAVTTPGTGFAAVYLADSGEEAEQWEMACWRNSYYGRYWTVSDRVQGFDRLMINDGTGSWNVSAAMFFASDAVIDSWLKCQFNIIGTTDTGQMLVMGYDTTDNRGIIQAGRSGDAYYPLWLNPWGSYVYIGAVSTDAISLYVKNGLIVNGNGMLSATTFSGTNVKATTLTGTTMSATTLSATNCYVTTLTATTVSADILSGGATNVGTISAHGIVHLQDNAVTWEDLQIPGLMMGFGASAPDAVTLCGAIQARAFDGVSTTEQAFLAVQLPHRYKNGSDLHPHVHWCKSDETTGDVAWALEYTLAISGSQFPATTTISAFGGDGNAGFVHDLMDLGAIDGTGLNQSTMIMCRLFRPRDDANDTYEADAILLACDFHYQVDSLGSDQEYEKSF